MALKLKFVDVERVKATADPLKIAKQKITEAIDLQKLAVAADVKGEDFKPSKERYVTKDGKSEKKTGPVRFSRWYWQNGGVWYTQIRYGQLPIVFDGKHSSIECGKKLGDVSDIYDQVSSGLKAGDLDSVINKMQAARSKAAKK